MSRVGTKPVAFLDSNVVLGFLNRESAAAHLLDDSVLSRVQLAINPVVLQEVLLQAGGTESSGRLAAAIESGVAMLPIDEKNLTELQNRASELRNRLVHSNDFLVLSSALNCDYLVTYDKMLFSLGGEVARVVTPEELLSLVRDGLERIF